MPRVKVSARKEKSSSKPAKSIKKSKMASSIGKKKVVEADSYERFISAEAKERYECLKKKKCLPERGFPAAPDKLQGFLAEPIGKHKWNIFCEVPDQANISLVKEFYANMERVGGAVCLRSVVRGKAVEVTPLVINESFQLEDDREAVFPSIIHGILDGMLVDVLSITTKEGTSWITSTHGKCTIMSRDLKSEAHVWLSFVKNRLMPTTHDTTVNQERMLLLYCILSGRKIDVGLTIWGEIAECPLKKSGKLFFPSLITKLCLEAGAPMCFDDELLEDSRIMNVDVLLHKHESKSGDIPSTSAPSSSNSISSLLKNIVKRLDGMEAHQKELCSYIQKRDAALRKSLQRNFTKPTESFPPFPHIVFEPWTAPDEEHTTEDPILSEESED